MNNRQLNKEFSQVMNDRNRFKKSGFTDSEDEDEETTNKSLKSPKSGRSTLSERSSLLSSRSPRREEILLTTKKKPVLNSIKRPEQRKVSPGSAEEDTISSPRKGSRFNQQLDAKSPRSDRSDSGSFPRFQRQSNYNDEEKITPRSSRSTSEKDDFNNMNMLSTMKKPLNDSIAFNKTLKRTDTFDNSVGIKQAQKIRAATPTKLSFSQKQQQSPAVTQRRIPMQSKFEDDIFEEDARLSSKSGKNSARSTPTHMSSNNNSLTNNRRPSNQSQSPNNSPPQHVSPTRSTARSLSPRGSLHINQEDDDEEDEEIDKEKMAYINHAKNVDILMNPNTQALTQTIKKSDEKPKKKITLEESARPVEGFANTEKDPQVVETIEDTKAIEKLQKQREAKRLEREKRAITQTESTKKIEEAIEQVENVMEDSIRFNNLKEKSQELKYSTRPTLNETRVFNIDRSRQGISLSARHSRTRSSSESGARFDRLIPDKYSHVKPKTQTRLPMQTARTETEFMNASRSSLIKQNDSLNDSSSIRQNIYNEWYQKKMSKAVDQLKEAQLRQKNDEELKAQELINKLEKSQVEYNKWCERKQDFIEKQKEKILNTKKLKKEEKDKKKEQKMIASKAFEEWVRIKKEQYIENKGEQNDKLLKTEKENRKQKEKKSDKPPLPFEAWAKKKENQINEKLKSEKQKELEKKLKEKEKEERKKLAELSYYEWLDKKEQLEDSKELNRSLSASMSSLPPFYPSSKTVPFGR